jgi:hypothetical protein
LPERLTSAGDRNPAEPLARWKEYTDVDEDDDVLAPHDSLAVTAPFERVRPGLARGLEAGTEPEGCVVRVAGGTDGRRDVLLAGGLGRLERRGAGP